MFQISSIHFYGNYAHPKWKNSTKRERKKKERKESNTKKRKKEKRKRKTKVFSLSDFLF